jgi:tRNA pseudouridine55 synthase
MFVAINKPRGITSHDVIYRLRKITSIKRIGHAGTLDPMASGVLVVGIGREYTKQLDTIVHSDKEYEATIGLDGTSDTGDMEGKIEYDTSYAPPTFAQVETAIQSFVGEIQQIPPIYSAIKLQGKKAYELARKGISVSLSPRTVLIHSIKVVSYDWPALSIAVHCGKGVYIRSLAVDIGAALGTGGYLTKLVRVRVGEYTLAKSVTLSEFEADWIKAHASDKSTDTTV